MKGTFASKIGKIFVGIEFVVITSMEDLLEKYPKIGDPGVRNFVADLETNSDDCILDMSAICPLAKIAHPGPNDFHSKDRTNAELGIP